MDVVIQKALDKIDVIMNKYCVEDIKDGKSNEIKDVINKILTEEAKLDESEYECIFGVDASNPNLPFFLDLNIKNINFRKQYDLGLIMRW